MFQAVFQQRSDFGSKAVSSQLLAKLRVEVLDSKIASAVCVCMLMCMYEYTGFVMPIRSHDYHVIIT